MALIKSISGIRGTIGGDPGEGLTPVDVVKFAAAYAHWLMQQDQGRKVVIGRDARVSGEMISGLVTNTLRSSGMNVVDLGLSTTPTVEMAVPWENAAGGIIVTASHNPTQWNALKLLDHKGEFLSAAEGEQVLQFAEAEDFHFTGIKKLGSYSQNEEALDKHIEAILKLPLVDKEAIRQKNFRIAIDAVNSSGGIAVPKLLDALGVEQYECHFCEPTGHFAHNPEPLPENLTHLTNVIEKGKFDLGIVVDPDVDRLAFVCEDGSPFGEEYTLVAVADYVLQHQKGNTVSNLSSTRALQDITEKAGQQYFASAVGEVNVVECMKANQAVIGGEGNGGVIYPELHYGRDALAGIALFLSHLAHFNKSMCQLRKRYPSYYISKNKVELKPEMDVDFILNEIRKQYKKQPINDTDGIRIDFENQWVHLRKSNTEPIIRVYTESDSESKAENLARKIGSDIKEIISVKAEEE